MSNFERSGGSGYLQLRDLSDLRDGALAADIDIDEGGVSEGNSEATIEKCEDLSFSKYMRGDRSGVLFWRGYAERVFERFDTGEDHV